jgi:hypothetical protein
MAKNDKKGSPTPRFPTFSASKRKASRAMQHIEELDRSIKSYFSRRWYTSSSRHLPDGNLDLQVRVFGTPRDADLAVGDAIHNLRAALDLAAVEAVRSGCGCGSSSCRSSPIRPGSPSRSVASLPAPAGGTRSSTGSSLSSPPTGAGSRCAIAKRSST